MQQQSQKSPAWTSCPDFHSLGTLYLEGQQQSIEVLSQLSTLEDITLRSISTKNRGLAEIGFVSSLTGLQFPFLQSLGNVGKIPDLSKLSKLRRLYLENMRGLDDVSAIASAPALEEFIHVSAQNVAPEKYKRLLQMPKLKSVLIGFGGHKKNRDFEKLVIASGKKIYGSSEFVFQ